MGIAIIADNLELLIPCIMGLSDSMIYTNDILLLY